MHKELQEAALKNAKLEHKLGGEGEGEGESDRRLAFHLEAAAGTRDFCGGPEGEWPRQWEEEGLLDIQDMLARYPPGNDPSDDASTAHSPSSPAAQAALQDADGQGGEVSPAPWSPGAGEAWVAGQGVVEGEGEAQRGKRAASTHRRSARPAATARHAPRRRPASALALSAAGGGGSGDLPLARTTPAAIYKLDQGARDVDAWIALFRSRDGGGSDSQDLFEMAASRPRPLHHHVYRSRLTAASGGGARLNKLEPAAGGGGWLPMQARAHIKAQQVRHHSSKPLIHPRRSAHAQQAQAPAAEAGETAEVAQGEMLQHRPGGQCAAAHLNHTLEKMAAAAHENAAVGTGAPPDLILGYGSQNVRKLTKRGFVPGAAKDGKGSVA